MKVLVTGKNGQLGYAVLKELEARGIESAGADLEDFDIIDNAQTIKYITACRPDAVVHCAAYTAVDRAEDEPAKCHAVNVEGTRNIVAACQEVSAKLVYISTDYVFPGQGTEDYEIDSPIAPLSVYGNTKYEGEIAVGSSMLKYFIIRTSWVFGKNGNNFVKTMLKLAEERDVISVVKDQTGSPTYTADLAKLIVIMLQSEKYGIYHATNEGYCNWAEFAAEIMSQAGLKTEILPIASAQFPTRAIRPSNSRLSKRSLDLAGFERLPSWQDALQRYLTETETKRA